MGVNIHQDSQAFSNVMEFVNDADGIQDMTVGGPSTPTSATPRFQSDTWVKMACASKVDTGGGIISWLNPWPYNVIVQGCMLDVTTQSTGTCTLEIGTTAVNATTVSTNLLVQSVAATGTFNGGLKSIKWVTGTWITVSTQTGTSTGLVANAYFNLSPA